MAMKTRSAHGRSITPFVSAQARQAEVAKVIARATESATIYVRTSISLMSRTATGDECAAVKQLLDEVIR